MSDQRIDAAATAASEGSADPGEGQGLSSPSAHAGGTTPGGGPATGDAPMAKDFQEEDGADVSDVEDAVTADMEGAQAMQRQASVADKGMEDAGAGESGS